MPQPASSARTRLREGLRTSLPTNVTLVQAVCAKIGPTIDLPNKTARATPPTRKRPGCAICGFQPFAHEFHQDAEHAALIRFQPRDKPTSTTAASTALLANLTLFF